MSKMNVHNICRKALDKWGRQAQELMLIEECSELIKAICKMYRTKDEHGTFEAKVKVIEELVDVELMHEQMKMIYIENISDQNMYNEIMNMKLKRLKEKLK